MQHNEPDFRNLPIPEQIEAPQPRYEPLNRVEISRNRRGMERANTLSNLQKLTPRPYMNSDSSFSQINEYEKHRNSLSRDTFPLTSNFGTRNSNTSAQEPSEHLQKPLAPSQMLEFPRFNPQSQGIEQYNNPQQLPDTFDLPRIYHSSQTSGMPLPHP